MMKAGRFPPAFGKPPTPAPAAAPLPTVPAESVEFDEEGRRLITSPLAPPPRPVPTVMPRPSLLRPPVAVPRPRPTGKFTPPAPAAAPMPTVPAESVEFDEEGRRLITSPLAPPPRPVPTVMPRPSLLRPPVAVPRPTGKFTPPAPAAAPVPTVPAESVEFDEEGRRLITSPLAPPPRPPAPKPVKLSRTTDGNMVPFGPDDIPY